jgi:signal recognition particle subunit SRP54
MFEELTSRFDSVFKKLRGRGTVGADDVSEAMREVRRALLEADVNFRVVKQFVAQVQEKALGAEVLRSITPAQQVVKVVQDELASLMGGSSQPVRYHSNRTNVILLAGLQGSGKTTAAAKLALFYRKQGNHTPLLVACDTHRAAAIDQLESLGKSLGIPVHAERGVDAVTVCRNAVARARREALSLVIVDTAGRLHIDESMMAELRAVKEAANPDDVLFVADAMTGQDAVNVAEEFHRQVAFTGVVLTKMDGDARGGAALSILHVTGVPVRYVGVGEKPDALEAFHPDRMASRILGMGDIVSLVERAQDVVDQEESQKLEKKIRRNQFTLQDFLDQLRQVRKMGSLGDLLSMIPGMGNQMKDVSVDEGALKRIEAAICSMTAQERAKPSIIDGSRRRRIARGSGTTVQEVNRLLNQFDSMRTMMKRMNKMMGKRGSAAALRSLMPMR